MLLSQKIVSLQNQSLCFTLNIKDMYRTKKDLNVLTFTLKIKQVRTSRKATSDGFNGFGKQRSNQFVTYGTYSSYVGKSGIYFIKNKYTNVYYIGSSTDIGSRLIKHFSQLRCGNHPNGPMLADYNKYGIECFDFGVLEFCDSDLSNKERDYQNQYGIENLYNLQIKGTFHSKKQLDSWKKADKSVYKTQDYRNKMKSLKSNKIGKFDKITCQLIETFNSTEEVCNKYNFTKSVIMGCCNGSKKSAYGYIWHYLDSENNIMLQGKGKNRDIIHVEDIV